MNRYTFFYLSDYGPDEFRATYCSRKLSSALRFFWRDSLKFPAPVTSLLPHYEVVNSKGRLSLRFLPEKYLEELV